MNFDDIDDSKRDLMIERLLDRPVTGATPAVWGFTNRTDFVTLSVTIVLQTAATGISKVLS